MKTFLKATALAAFLLSSLNLHAQPKHDTSQWEKEIAAFEASDRVSPPPQNGILFVGSSSFRKWTTLSNDFAGLPVINRGFGGSQIPDSTALAERIIFPYHPRIIVFYAGDNDFAAGRTTGQVAADYREFVAKVHSQLPKTTIAFLSIKPSPLRWNLHEKMAAANDAIKAMSSDNLKFIDVYSQMLDAGGKPKPGLYLSDGLHPSPACYQLWTGIIRPYLE